ncbi:MAG: TfoX/Sxy family protein [Gemmatimonadaceae bacterium]
MAYDEKLAERIRAAYKGNKLVTEKKMFGGIAFLRKGLMFVGVSDNALMARVGKEHHTDSMMRQHVRPMDFTGKPMTGYVVRGCARLEDRRAAALLAGAVRTLRLHAAAEEAEVRHAVGLCCHREIRLRSSGWPRRLSRNRRRCGRSRRRREAPRKRTQDSSRT